MEERDLDLTYLSLSLLPKKQTLSNYPISINPLATSLSPASSSWPRALSSPKAIAVCYSNNVWHLDIFDIKGTFDNILQEKQGLVTNNSSSSAKSHIQKMAGGGPGWLGR